MVSGAYKNRSKKRISLFYRTSRALIKALAVFQFLLFCCVPVHHFLPKYLKFRSSFGLLLLSLISFLVCHDLVLFLTTPKMWTLFRCIFETRRRVKADFSFIVLACTISCSISSTAFYKIIFNCFQYDARIINVLIAGHG